jgi:hypothetical protein
MIDSIIKKVLKEEFFRGMTLNENIEVSDSLMYHIKKRIPLSENVYKMYSKSFFNLINEVRELFEEGLINLNENDKELVESDLGKKVKLADGQIVYLEVPIEDVNFLSEAEYQGRKVQLLSLIHI